MKKANKLFAIVLITALVAVMGIALAACNNDNDPTTLRFAAPEGTPALAITRLVTDNKTISGYNMEYGIVASSNIAVEMSSANADLIIMPVNAGSRLITQGAGYKLVSVAVDGSLYLVGKADTATTLTMDDIKGKKIACIGKTGTPGLVFRYIMSSNGITVTEATGGTPSANEVFVNYVADGTAARTLLADGGVDFAVVGEPAATAFKGAIGARAEMNMQAEYASITGKETYPQAGLFVRTSLAENSTFMTKLFAALAESKEWVTQNPADVTEFAKANLYASANFPAASISRCAIDATALTDGKKAEIVQFLKAVMPKDSSGNAIDWDAASIF